jgi:hypothetical protein
LDLRAFFRPCAIASTNRVLRRAWTADRLTGSLHIPESKLSGYLAFDNVNVKTPVTTKVLSRYSGNGNDNTASCNLRM